MLGLARWCMAHRRRVIVAWLVVAVLVTVVAQAVGPKYASVYSLPGTETQRAHDLLAKAQAVLRMAVDADPELSRLEPADDTLSMRPPSVP